MQQFDNVHPLLAMAHLSKPTNDAELRIVTSLVDQACDNHPWNEEKRFASANVLRDIKAAMVSVMVNLKPSADRTVAVRKLHEALMEANYAITHQ